MAEQDIALNIRIREADTAAISRIQQQLNQLRQNAAGDIKLNVDLGSTARAEAAVQRLGQSLQGLEQRAAAVRRQMGGFTGSSTGPWPGFARPTPSPSGDFSPWSAGWQQGVPSTPPPRQPPSAPQPAPPWPRGGAAGSFGAPPPGLFRTPAAAQRPVTGGDWFPDLPPPGGGYTPPGGPGSPGPAGPGGGDPQMSGGNWRRVAPGAAIRPVAISPEQGPPSRLQQAWLSAQQPPSPLQQRLQAHTVRQMQQAQLVSILAQTPTPLQQAWLTLQQTPSPLQQHQQAQAAHQTAQQMQHAQLVSILGQTPTPLQQAHHQLSTFGTPLQIAHGYQHSLGVAQAQAGLQKAQLISLIAQMGPQGGPGLSGAVSGLTGVPMSTLGKVAAGVTAGTALATGYTPYGLYNIGMQAYEERELGVLKVGTMLDEQYGEVRETIIGLGHDFKLTAREGVAAMEALGRAGGTQAVNRGGVRQAMAVARAYGIDPVHMATLYGRTSLIGTDVVPQIAETIPQYNQARALGLTRLPFGRFLDESAAIQEYGGFGAAPMSRAEADRYTALMGEFGPRAQADPSGYFAQQAQSMDIRNKGPMGAALSYQALRRLSETTPFVEIGGKEGDPGYMKLDIRGNYLHQQIALQNAFQIPAMREALEQEATIQGGGNPIYGQLVYNTLFPGRNMYQSMMERAGTQRARARPETPLGAAPTEQQLIDRQWGYVPGAGTQATPANLETLSETLLIGDMQKLRRAAASEIAGMVAIPEQLAKAGQAVRDALGDLGGKAVTNLGQSFDELRGIVIQLKDAFQDIVTLRGPADTPPPGWQGPPVPTTARKAAP